MNPIRSESGGCVDVTLRDRSGHQEAYLGLLVWVCVLFKQQMTDDAGQMTDQNFAELLTCMIGRDVSENPV